MNSYFQIAIFAAALASGIYLEHEFQLASQTVEAYRWVADAQRGEVSIIKDNQIIAKDIHNDKDPCLNKPVPANLNKLLR